MIFLLLLLFILHGLYQRYKTANPDFDYEVVEIKNENLKKAVNVDGKVLADYEITLASEIPGIMSKKYVEEGQKVKKGQLLLKIKDSDYRTQLNSAYANINLNKAGYEKTKNPNQNLDLDLKLAENNRKITLENITKIRDDIKSGIDDLNIFLDQKLRLEIDDYFAHLDSYPVFNRRLAHEDEMSALEEMRYQLGQSFKLYSEKEEVALDEAIVISGEFEKMAEKLYEASKNFLGYTDTEREEQEKKLSELKESISLKKNNLITLKNQLEILEKQLDNNQILEEKTKNVVSEADLKIAEEKIKAAQVSANNAYLQLQKTYIRAPRSGLVVKVYKDEGEYLSPSEPLVKINSAGFYFEVKIPEVDVAKIAVGMEAEIKLDAFGDKLFKGKLSFIYPESEEIFGINYYRAKILFDEDEENKKILPGMLGEANIILEKKEGLPALSRKLVEKDEKGYFVMILNPKKEGIFDKKFLKKYFSAGFVGENYLEVGADDFKGLKIVKLKK